MRHLSLFAALGLLCGSLAAAEVVIDLGDLESEYVITNSETYVFQSGRSNMHGWVTVKSGSPTLVFDNVSASAFTTKKLFCIESHSPVVIELPEGTINNIAMLSHIDPKAADPTPSCAPIDLADGSDVTITGSGLLTITSQMPGCACIGTGPNSSAVYSLTISGGILELYPADQSAAIGGGLRSHCYVTITGGRIWDTQGGNPGEKHCTIGCGTDGYLDRLTISGGCVETYGFGSSPGIGCLGENKSEDSLIRITDGFVAAGSDALMLEPPVPDALAVGAESGEQPRIEIVGGCVFIEGSTGSQPVNSFDAPVYSVIMEDITYGMTSVVLTVTQGGHDYPYIFNCDDEWLLDSLPGVIFYLPTGNYVVSGGVQQYGGTVEAHDMNVFTVVPEPACCLLALLGLALLRRK